MTTRLTIEHIRTGRSLHEAFYRADLFTGKVLLLIGLTLSASVATWAWSPIKFQADMGLLLTFMSFMNMLGALILHPALACFLYPVVTTTIRRKLCSRTSGL